MFQRGRSYSVMWDVRSGVWIVPTNSRTTELRVHGDTGVPSSMITIGENVAHEPLAARLLNLLLGQTPQWYHRVTPTHFAQGSTACEETCHGSTSQPGSFTNASLSSRKQVMDQIPSTSGHTACSKGTAMGTCSTSRCQTTFWSPSCKPDLWRCSPSPIFPEPHPSPPACKGPDAWK